MLALFNRKTIFGVTCFAEATFGSPHSLTFFSKYSKSALPAYVNIHFDKVNQKALLKEKIKMLEEFYLYLSPNFSVKTLVSFTDKLRQRTILRASIMRKVQFDSQKRFKGFH